MTYASLKTMVADYLNRSDLSSQIGDFINMAIHHTERENDWKCMLANTTGSFTSSIDYIAEPTRYKASRALLITINSTWQEYLQRVDWMYLKAWDGYGSNSKQRPMYYSFDDVNSQIKVRPYPDQTYAYELEYYAYTADLSADADTNFWTTSAWEIPLYGALLQAKPFLMDDERIKVWLEYYRAAVAVLKKAERREERQGALTTLPAYRS